MLKRFHPDARRLDLGRRRELEGIFGALEKANLVVMDCALYPVLCKNYSASSGDTFRVVMIQQSAQGHIAAHCGWRRWLFRILISQWDDIVQSLMRSLLIVMMLNLLEHVSQMSFTQENQLVQRFPGLPHEPLRISVAHR